MRLWGQRDCHNKLEQYKWFGQWNKPIIVINDRDPLTKRLDIEERELTYNGGPFKIKGTQIPRIYLDYEKPDWIHHICSSKEKPPRK